MGFLKFIPDLFNVVSTTIGGWHERKKARLDSDLKINEAKTQANITKILEGQKADVAWENTSINNSGWKDEWFTVVLSIPAIMCFIPGLASFVYDGFTALSNCPQWYQWALMVAVASSFGYRKLADLMALRKGD